MKCEFCEGMTETRATRKQHWRKGRLYLVENVPTQVCVECGERYYHASTLAEINRMLDHAHHVKEVLEVEVVAV
ncbi:MAG: type II toxin-antitoxin system MqsA family antitoxin [bacterium]